MKFCKSLFFLLFLTSFFSITSISCSKKIPEEEVAEEIPLPVETFVEGRILSKKASLCILGRDSAMHPLVKLSAGDSVSILKIDNVIQTKNLGDSNLSEGKEGQSPSAENSTGLVSATSAAAAENKNLVQEEYYHVVYDNVDFWLDKRVCALNCENAVAIEKTFLYSDPALSQKINSPHNPLKFSTVIARSLEESPDENPASVKIFYFDQKAGSVQEAFVSSSSISSKIDDIVVSQVAEALKTTKRAVPRNELFAKAAKYKPSPKVLAALNAQKEERVVNSYREVLRNMQKMTYGVNVDELMTVDQTKDPFQ